jgi:hypothetical protein
VKGSEFRAKGSEFRAKDSEFRAKGSEFRAKSLGVWVVGLRDLLSWF